MHRSDLVKISDVNGFDVHDPNNARQNNYAWSMAEFGEYIYVGTGRNIVYLALVSQGLEPFPEIAPPNPTLNAEIWRYPKHGHHKKWERVFTASPEWQLYGVRSMIVYTDEMGRQGICCGCTSLRNDQSFSLRSFDGVNWSLMNSALPPGFNTRTMAIYNGTLYSGANNPEGYGETSYLAAARNFDNGFYQVPILNGVNTPRGEIMSMAVFNGYLYIGTALAGGFGVWKSNNPEASQWTLVVDQGAGDALNEWAMTMEVHNDHLYVGSANLYGIRSVDSEKGVLPLKGFDLIRINCYDQWEVVVGGEPIQPTFPITGVRNMGAYPSGFGNSFNAYCWQLCSHQGKLYVSSWDCALIYRDTLLSILQNRELGEVVGGNGILDEDYNWLQFFYALTQSLLKYPKDYGFDLYSNARGNCFDTLSINGFENRYNYGLRTMLSADDGKLYMGTANPYEGCEVWVYGNDRNCHDHYRNCSDFYWVQ